MRKLIFGLTLLVTMLMSCAEDEDKVIQTDLPTEANEMFRISKAWNESLYFAMISWEEYLQIDSLQLPNDPIVHINQASKEVTLEFIADSASIKANKNYRLGKLIIAYDTTVLSPNRKWSMEFDDYLFRTDAIYGKRNFSSDDSLVFSEEFTDLIVKTEKELSSTFSGRFVHAESYAADSSRSISSSGRMAGVNPVGRDFEIILDSPTTHSVFCYQQNEIIPKTGKETWIVSRAGNSSVNYTTTYEALPDTCKVAVNTILPDGRKLLLNP